MYEASAWTEDENKLVYDHFIRLKNNHLNGKVILAGKTIKDSGFGIVIFKAEMKKMLINICKKTPLLKVRL